MALKKNLADDTGPEMELDRIDYMLLVAWMIVTWLCVIIGMYVSHRLGDGYPDEWLGFTLGGAFGGGLIYYQLCKVRPRFGHPAAAIRVASIFVVFGVTAYLTARWLGPVVQVLGLVLVVSIYYAHYLSMGTVRLVTGWMSRRSKKPRTEYLPGGIWDRELDE